MPSIPPARLKPGIDIDTKIADAKLLAMQA